MGEGGIAVRFGGRGDVNRIERLESVAGAELSGSIADGLGQEDLDRIGWGGEKSVSNSRDRARSPA